MHRNALSEYRHTPLPNGIYSAKENFFPDPPTSCFWLSWLPVSVKYRGVLEMSRGRMGGWGMGLWRSEEVFSLHKLFFVCHLFMQGFCFGSGPPSAFLFFLRCRNCFLFLFSGPAWIFFSVFPPDPSHHFSNALRLPFENTNIERFNTTSRRPCWCTKPKERQPFN